MSERGMASTGIISAEQPPTKGTGRGKRLALRIACAVLLVALLAGNVVQLVLNRRLSDENEVWRQSYSPEYLYSNSITLARFYQMQQAGESFIVTISRPNCGTCQGFEAEYHQILERNGLTETVYYLNVAELRRDNEAWAAFKEAYGIQGTPSYVAINEGTLAASAGWTPDDGLDGAQIEQWMVEQAALLAHG